MKPLVIVGAGGHGREALDIAFAINDVAPTYDVLGFIDDGLLPGSTAKPHELSVLGGLDIVPKLGAAVAVAVGQPLSRRSIVNRLGAVEFVDLVHPQASIGSYVQHGPGLIMAAGSRLTHAVTLGMHVHLNVDASINHDCRIGDFVTITPGARLSGAVSVGDQVWMGVNSSAIQGVHIGARAIIGAGAAVVNDIADGVTAVGVPARPIGSGPYE